MTYVQSVLEIVQYIGTYVSVQNVESNAVLIWQHSKVLGNVYVHDVSLRCRETSRVSPL